MTNLVERILSEPVTALDPALSYFECLPVAALLFAADGAIVAANAAAHSLFGAAPGALSGRAAELHFPEAPRETDAPHRVEARRMDGSTFPARLRIASIATHPRANVIVIVDDVGDFERELAARAAEVVAANREFEKFIDVAAHDLRAPLRILTGFADALEDETNGTLNEDATSFMKEIRTSSARMEGIIDGLLMLARSTRAEMSCEPLDLTTLVELVCFELRHSDTAREVTWQIAPDLNAWGDVRLMMTVLRALIGNAWKFTGRTTAAAIRFYPEERGGRTWFCISDNGAGFDMAHAERLFKPFTRLHRQDEFAGHGMGLATAEVIVRRHGGGIEAEAAPGVGATIRFWLAPRPE
jgi:light-regulated signal transduction histidine kinase (bacteriophytochrome)